MNANKWNGFGSLDLTDIEESKSRLEAGRYIVVCKEAKVEQQEGTQNRKVVAIFEDVGGAGDIRANFNIFHTSEQATEIGLRQLKTFLINAGHPNPNRPGDIATLKGLKVGIVVGMGKPYMDKNGKARQNTEVKAYYDPNGPAPEVRETAPAAAGDRDLNDGIPF